MEVLCEVLLSDIFFCCPLLLVLILLLRLILVFPNLQVLCSMQPIIVYFADSSQWLSRVVPKSNHKDFVSKVQEMFDQLPGPVVLICGQNKAETGSKERERFVSFKSLSSYMHPYTYIHVGSI